VTNIANDCPGDANERVTVMFESKSFEQKWSTCKSFWTITDFSSQL